MFESFKLPKEALPTYEQKELKFPGTRLSKLRSAARGVKGVIGIGESMKGYPDSDIEPMSELLAPTGLKIFQKMRKSDPIVGGLMLLLDTVVKRMQINLTGDNAEFVQEVLDNMSIAMPELLGEIASAFTYGFYLGEKVWEMADGRMWLVDIEPRHQPTIEAINDDKGLVIQQTSVGQLSCPYDKCLHIVLLAENRHPFGVSLLRHLYKPYYYKVSIEASEALSLDRDLGGLPILTAPEGFDFTAATEGAPNYDANVAATLEWAIDLVSSVRRDQQQGVVKPFGWNFEIVRGENRASVPTTDIIARYNTEMASGILANFLALGAFATTNNSNSQMHVSNFLSACEAYAKTISDALQRQVIIPICAYNKLDSFPTIDLKVKNISILKDLGNFLSSLIDKGLVKPNNVLEKAVLDLANLPYTEGEQDAKRDPNTDNS